MAEGVPQEFREQVQVPESEQEYPERVGLDRFQRGRRWEQEAEEGVPQEFREQKLLGYQEYYLLDSIHLPQQLYYL